MSWPHQTRCSTNCFVFYDLQSGEAHSMSDEIRSLRRGASDQFVVRQWMLFNSQKWVRQELAVAPSLLCIIITL
jgi:hypothetical protein